MMMMMMMGGDDDDDGGDGGDDDDDVDDDDDDGDDEEDDGDDDDDDDYDDGVDVDDDVDVDVDVEEEEDDDVEEDDVEKEARSQDREAHFVRARAVEMHTGISQEPFCRGHLRGHRFGRACAVEMHMDISQEPFFVEIYRDNAGRPGDHLDQTPGLNTYRKNPVSVATLFGEKRRTQEILFPRINFLIAHHASTAFFLKLDVHNELVIFHCKR